MVCSSCYFRPYFFRKVCEFKFYFSFSFIFTKDSKFPFHRKVFWMTDSGQKPSCDMALVTLKTLWPKKSFQTAIPIKSSILHLANAFATTLVLQNSIALRSCSPLLSLFYRNRIIMTNIHNVLWKHTIMCTSVLALLKKYTKLVYRCQNWPRLSPGYQAI